MPLALLPGSQALGGENRRNFLNGLVKVFVDNQVIKLVVMAHLLTGRRQTQGDDRLTVLTAAAQTSFKFGDRWWQDEN